MKVQKRNYQITKKLIIQKKNVKQLLDSVDDYKDFKFSDEKYEIEKDNKIKGFIFNLNDNKLYKNLTFDPVNQKIKFKKEKVEGEEEVEELDNVELDLNNFRDI